MRCRTIEEVLAAADAESVNQPPLTQEQADKVAAILVAARWQKRNDSAR